MGLRKTTTRILLVVGVLLLLALLLLPRSCSPGPAFPDTPLETLSGAKAAPLSGCPTAKCLTIVVAPWCGICQAVVPHILELRKHLDAQGVTTRVVVGYAPLETLKTFAAPYGPDTQLDPSGERTPPKDGIPLFVVTDHEGRSLKRVVGFPSGSTSPESLAAAFSLP